MFWKTVKTKENTKKALMSLTLTGEYEVAGGECKLIHSDFNKNKTYWLLWNCLFNFMASQLLLVFLFTGENNIERDISLTIIPCNQRWMVKNIYSMKNISMIFSIIIWEEPNSMSILQTNY